MPYTVWQYYMYNAVNDIKRSSTFPQWYSFVLIDEILNKRTLHAESLTEQDYNIMSDKRALCKILILRDFRSLIKKNTSECKT